MATPRMVKFSRISGTPEELLGRLDEGVLREFGFDYYECAPLRPDLDPSPYNPGLELVHDLIRCNSREQALRMAAPWGAWTVSFLARRVPGHLDVVFFDIEPNAFSVTMGLDPGVISYETEELAGGEWIRRLLIGITVTCRCSVCGFGRDDAYCVRYETLDPDAMVQRAGRGELFTMAFPNFNAISTKLIGVEVMNDLLLKLPKSEFMDYRAAIAGYHVISQLP